MQKNSVKLVLTESGVLVIEKSKDIVINSGNFVIRIRLKSQIQSGVRTTKITFVSALWNMS